MESLAFAKHFKEWIADEVRTQLAKAAPPRRIAQVTSLEPDKRRANVIYVGESSDNVVSLPYNSTTPTGAGQFVIVDGPPGDRSIVDVLGADNAEHRLDQVAATSPPIPMALSKSPRISESFPLTMRPNDPNNDFRFSLAANIPLYVPVQITHTADYERIFTHFTVNATNSTGVNMAVYKYLLESANPDNGETAYDMRRVAQCSITNVENPPNNLALIPLDESLHLEQGDTVVIAIYYTGSPQMHVSALFHTSVPMLHVPPYTLAWSNGTVSGHAELVKDSGLSKAADKTAYAGLFH